MFKHTSRELNRECCKLIKFSIKVVLIGHFFYCANFFSFALIVMEKQKKYRFRKLYFHCTDKRIFSHETNQVTNAFKERAYAESNLESQRTRHYMWEDNTKPLPVKTVEGFYLVPEALFELILKEWYREE